MNKTTRELEGKINNQIRIGDIDAHHLVIAQMASQIYVGNYAAIIACKGNLNVSDAEIITDAVSVAHEIVAAVLRQHEIGL